MSSDNDTGYVTETPDAAIAIHRRVKKTATGVAVCGADDPTYGTNYRAGFAADADSGTKLDIPIKLWNSSGTHFATITAAIAEGAEFQGAADGKIAPLTTGPAIGRTRKAGSAANVVIEVVYYPPQSAAGGGGGALSGAGMPLSGTSGTGAGDEANITYYDTTNDVLYVNEGTVASPYWTPAGFDQRGLLACYSDFRDGVGKAVSNTDGSTTVPGSGLRVFGQGIAETDSGLTVAYSENGPIGSLLTTNEAAHTAALSAFGSTANWQPDTHGAMVIDVELTNNSAITDRALFLGFLGTVADALDPAVTGSGTTLTLVQDDLAGLFFDSGLTDADRLYAAHNKSNEAASIETTATGVDTSTNIAAAGTYQRLRVEISSAGVMTCFADKAQITSISAALDVDEEVAPCVYVESNAAAIKQIDVKNVAMYTSRSA